MTILTRDQIDALAQEDEDDPRLIDTARAYHDLRDAVLALCDEVGPWTFIDDMTAARWRALEDVREVVARVETGTP